MKPTSTRMLARSVAVTVAAVGAGMVPLALPAAAAETFVVTKTAGGYQASSGSQTYSGSLKSVVEDAVRDLRGGGGTISFVAGTFDLGSDFFKLSNVSNVVFEGAGMGSTTIQNNNSSADDTEPFNFTGVDNVTVRDMTVRAGGAPRNTSDALDFDNGSNNVVSNVAITLSRGRGIVFDGKNVSSSGEVWSSSNNRVSGCLIENAHSDGIELLASSDDIIEDCTIRNVGGHGIQIAKASQQSDQPGKKSSDNTIRNNTITGVGEDGINLNGGDGNRIINNVITNSSSRLANKDGIKLSSGDLVTCNDNYVQGNRANDTRSTPVQRWGLAISSALCSRTVVGGNDFTGNRAGEIMDRGTGTIYSNDPPPPPGTKRPVADFAASDTDGNAAHTVQFTDRSAHSPTSWLWNFGDGNTSTSQSPSHTFQQPGQYTVTLRATNTAGTSDPKTMTISVYSAAGPTTAMVKPGHKFHKTRTVKTSWKSVGGWPGAASYDVSLRSAFLTGKFGASQDWLTTQGKSASFQGTPGGTYCLRVQGTDAIGNTGKKSTERCASIPLDDRSMNTKGNWQERSPKKAFEGTVMRSQQQGAELRHFVRAKDIRLMVTRCPRCGVVKVYLGKTMLKRVNLKAPSVRTKRLVKVAQFNGVKSGVVRVVVATKGKPVMIDGLGASRR